jgi:hypothetical protein
MSERVTSEDASTGQAVTARVILAALGGMVGGLVTTAVALRSFEFGILGAVGGALVVMIGTLTRLESAEV